MHEPHAMTAAGHQILAAAEDLFYHRGITAVGVDLIAQHSGVTKRTLYNQFGSKDRLVALYLEERTRRWQVDVRAAVDARDDAVDAVLAPFDVLRTWSEANARGCAAINALAELPDPSHPAHAVAVGQKLWLLDLFTELARTAGCSEPAALARRLLVLHDGVLAVQPLGLDILAETTSTARGLVRDSVGEVGEVGEVGRKDGD